MCNGPHTPKKLRKVDTEPRQPFTRTDGTPSKAMTAQRSITSQWRVDEETAKKIVAEERERESTRKIKSRSRKIEFRKKT